MTYLEYAKQNGHSEEWISNAVDGLFDKNRDMDNVVESDQYSTTYDMGNGYFLITNNSSFDVVERRDESGEVLESWDLEEISPEVKKYLSEIGKRGGKKGGSSRTPKKSASSAANLGKARAEGKTGGYPKNRPREYYTADRETYTVIDKFTSKKAAQAAIKKYLDEDRDLSQSGITEYDENFYIILDYEKKEIK